LHSLPSGLLGQSSEPVLKRDGPRLQAGQLTTSAATSLVASTATFASFPDRVTTSGRRSTIGLTIAMSRIVRFPCLDFFGAERAPSVVRSRQGFSSASLPFLAVAG